MRQSGLLAVVLVLLGVAAQAAAADDGRTHFRRTTPRASLEEEAGTFTLGVPSGRAWSATGRPRQIAIVDSEAVAAGEGRLLFVALDPPPGAVAYRIRVLARLRAGSERSQDAAIQARVSLVDRAATHFGSLFSRLLPDGP